MKRSVSDDSVSKSLEAEECCEEESYGTGSGGEAEAGRKYSLV